MKAHIETDKQGRKKTFNACDEPCAIERGMRIIGGKWTGSVLWHLKDNPVRFNDLSRMIGGASKKMLSERLKHLEEHGLIERRVLDTRPVGVAYRPSLCDARWGGGYDHINRMGVQHDGEGADSARVPR